MDFKYARFEIDSYVNKLSKCVDHRAAYFCACLSTQTADIIPYTFLIAKPRTPPSTLNGLARNFSTVPYKSSRKCDDLSNLQVIPPPPLPSSGFKIFRSD